MWFRRLVGVAMIISFIGLNAIVIVGLVTAPEVEPSQLEQAQNQPATVVSELPTVSLTANPGSVSANTPAGLSWETTGSPDTCEAAGDWSGPKTAFGSESTGRLKDVKTYTFKLTCKNQAGSAEATIDVAVTPASATPSAQPAAAAKSSSPKPAAATYCDGRVPCYGPKDVSSHGSGGNCWGYNGDRVINISSFDSGYHKSKSGISSIEIGGVCGTNLATALNKGVSADSQTRDHNESTKSNSDKNLFPYFVGYYDGGKP